MKEALAETPIDAPAQRSWESQAAPRQGLDEAAPGLRPAAGTRSTPVPLRQCSPTEWVLADDERPTPVIDRTSHHLSAACTALEAGDTPSAARSLRAMALELKVTAGAVAISGALESPDGEALAQTTSWRLASSAVKVNAAAFSLEGGRSTIVVPLHALVGKSTLADIESRWLCAGRSVWFPVYLEPQRHLLGAIDAHRRFDTASELQEVRKACAYLRLEAARTWGYPRMALDTALVDLGRIAADLANARITNAGSREQSFASASLALSMSHRHHAAESWVGRRYEDAGYGFKAAAACLANATHWAGADTSKEWRRASLAVGAIGEQLILGCREIRDEVIRAMKAYGRVIQALGHEIGRMAPAVVPPGQAAPSAQGGDGSRA